MSRDVYEFFFMKTIMLACFFKKRLSNKYFVNHFTMLTMLILDHREFSLTCTHDHETND
jgi:hypothetical protein